MATAQACSRSLVGCRALLPRLSGRGDRSASWLIRRHQRKPEKYGVSARDGGPNSTWLSSSSLVIAAAPSIGRRQCYRPAVSAAVTDITELAISSCARLISITALPPGHRHRGIAA